MITYFSEQDLVSFGNYLLSSDRREFYLKQGIEESKASLLLESVNNIDLTNWVNLIINQQRKQQEVIINQNEDILEPEVSPDSKPLRIVE